MWRGFTLSDFINQCYSNDEDLGRGRQMPIHYGSRKLNFITLSSPLATQVPQGKVILFFLFIYFYLRVLWLILQLRSL